MSKSLEELKDLFENFDGDLRAKFIKKFPEIWDDAYDIEMGSRYHRVMTSCMLAGWFAAIKAVSEREKKLVEALEKINSEELSSQRPGGGFSMSARISYEALEKYRKFKEGLK
jgi:hypothetical protein